MSNVNRVLFLPEWYPNKTHLSVGSFIRVHAEAINTKIPVDILHVCGDFNTKRIYSFEKSVVNGVDTYILYYRKSRLKDPISQLVKAILCVVGQFYGYYLYRKIKPRPLLLHVHVLTRAAILPYILNFFGNSVRYFITEHWSRYLPQDNSYKGSLRKLVTKSIVKNSNGVTAVSQDLKFHMNRHKLIHENFKVISNVTQDVFFRKDDGLKTRQNYFVHVSNFAANCKNVLGILAAFKILQDTGYSVSLKMVGDGDDFELAKLKVMEYGLNNVFFTGFLYGQNVVDAMSEANALIMFSSYENQPVVITESLSLGVPVIATTVGGIPEMINDSNGILVEPRDVEALSNAVKRIITGDVNFDREQIKKEAAKKYKGDVIAQQFIEFYRAGGVDI